MVLADNLKKIILAGIGTVASTAEKSKELIEEMVKKGEITVDESKILNSEFASTLKNKSQDIRETIKKRTARMAPEFDFAEFIASLSEEQLDALKEEIEAYEAAKDQIVSLYEEETTEEEAVEEEALAAEEAPAEEE